MKRTPVTKRDEKRRGFTLIEVMLVVAILGMLVGVVAVGFRGRSVKAAISATRASINAVSQAVELYEVDTGRYPASMQSLLSDDGSSNWNGPYVRGGKAPLDAWGKPLKLEVSGNSFKVISDGPPDKGEPITSW